MRFQVFFRLNLIILFTAQTLPLIRTVLATPNSVCQQPGYYSIHPCAQGCIGCDPRPDQIAYKIGCGNVPPNECWCATNLFTIATSALSDCVSRSCTLGDWHSDYTAAEGFYTSYCEGAGFTGVRGGEEEGGGGSVVVIKTTVAGGGTGTTTIYGNGPPARTGTGDEGDGGTDGPAADGSGGLSSSDRIALGVGIGLGLPATFAGVVTCVMQLRARARRMADGLPGGTVR